MIKTFGKLFTSGSDSADSNEDLEKFTNFTPGENIIDLEAQLKKLKKTYSNGLDGFEIEFETLQKYEKIQQRNGNTFKTAQLPKNSKKNRYQKIYANERTRVKLTDPKKDGSDYINANYIPSDVLFSTKYSYIATQAPLQNTFEDFWRMIFEKNSKIIVMLAEEEDEKEVFISCSIKAHRYWPKLGKEEKYGDFIIENVSELIVQDFCLP